MTLALLVAVVLVSSALPAAAQATTTLSGTVVDSAGGVIPGATVVVSNKGTGTKFTAVTDGNGAFSVPALDAGLYSVTVSLMGFKTAVIDDVRLLPACRRRSRRRSKSAASRRRSSSTSSSELVNTQTATVVVDAQRRSDQPDADCRRATR